MMKRSYRMFLEDILGSIDKIGKYVRRLDYEDFIRDDKTLDAVIRNLEIIGELQKTSLLVQEINILRFLGKEWRVCEALLLMNALVLIGFNLLFCPLFASNRLIYKRAER